MWVWSREKWAWSRDTDHMSDPIPAKVELSERGKPSQPSNHGDLIASKIEHTQMGKMIQALNFLYLNHEQKHTHTHTRTHTHTHTMFPWRSNTSIFVNLSKPEM